MTTEGGHKTIYYCPYCGEEDIEPDGDEGAWVCGSCTRAFVVKSVRPQR